VHWTTTAEFRIRSTPGCHFLVQIWKTRLNFWRSCSSLHHLLTVCSHVHNNCQSSFMVLSFSMRCGCLRLVTVIRCMDTVVLSFDVLLYYIIVCCVLQAPKVAQELSDLVTYCQAKSFRTLDCSQPNRECCALGLSIFYLLTKMCLCSVCLCHIISYHIISYLICSIKTMS